MENSKIENKVVVAVSGGFDPIHVGHVRMMEEAKKLGTHLVVIVNNDNWLRTKKGFVFMPEAERVELIRALGCVDEVVLTDHSENDSDRTVCRALDAVRPDIFSNGGDRGEGNTPEADLCGRLGIRMVYGVGAGGKLQSSSWLVQDALRAMKRSVRPWGHFHAHDKGEKWYLKTISVEAGHRLSLQYHHRRDEYWMLVEGDAVATVGDSLDTLMRIPLVIGEVQHIPLGDIHRLESVNGGVIVEIAMGDFDENDIVRLEDDYARGAK